MYDQQNLSKEGNPTKWVNFLQHGKDSSPLHGWATVDYKLCWTSALRTPKGQSNVSILERCPFHRGHSNEVLEDYINSYRCSLVKHFLSVLIRTFTT